MCRKYLIALQKIANWYLTGVNSTIDVNSIKILKYLKPNITRYTFSPCKVEILSYYLSVLRKNTPALPFLFDGSDFWEKPFELFIDIGSGHGELLYAWPQLAIRYPDLFFNELLEKTGLYPSVNKNKRSYPVVIGFETKQRYYKLLLDLVKFEFNYIKGSFSSAQDFYPVLGCPQWLIYKEDGFLATKKFKYNSVSGIFVFFPDPWNKKRHYKRRDVKIEWLLEAFYRLKTTGFILITTDHPDYAKFIRAQLKLLKEKLDKYVEIEMFNKFVPFEWGLPATYYYKKNIKKTDVFAFLIKKRYQG